MRENRASNTQQTRRTTAIAVGVQVALLVALTIAAYVPALSASYIWDDDVYLTTNYNVTSRDGLWRTWSRLESNPQYYPLVFTSFWLEFRVWGGRAIGYHLDNILLHAGNAALIYIVLRKLRVPGAWLAAAFFALHPVHVESVAWITERKNVLSTFFYLLALLSYLHFSQLASTDPSTQVAERRWAWYPVANACFALALFSKTVACSLPAAILLLIWWKRGRIRKVDLLPLLPMFALGLGMALVTSWVEHRHVGTKDLGLNLTPAGRIVLAGQAVWFYLGKLALPAPLIFIYPKWMVQPSSVPQWIPSVSLAALLVALFVLRNRIGRGPLVAALLYVGTLVPALGFVDIYLMRYSWVADHFQYLASIAAVATFAALVLRLARNRTAAAVACAIPILAGLSVLTWRYERVFRDYISLWSDVVAKNPTAWIGSQNLAAALSDAGRVGEAKQVLARAVDLNPRDDFAHYQFSLIALRCGDPRWAGEIAEAAIRSGLDSHSTRLALALSQLEMSQTTEAVDNLERAIHYKPDLAIGHFVLSKALTRLGRTDDARNHFDRAVELDPGNPEVCCQLGEALSAKGELQSAEENYRRALERRPDFARVRFNLAQLLATQNRFAESIDELKQVIGAQPLRADAHHLLGILLLRSNRPADAIQPLLAAIQLNPKLVKARLDLAGALFEASRFEEAATQYREVLRSDPANQEAAAGLSALLARRAP